MNNIIKTKTDEDNIEYKIIKTDAIVKGIKHEYSFIMIDLDSNTLITAVHCQTMEQAENRYNKSVK